jgi:hypothetical protein
MINYPFRRMDRLKTNERKEVARKKTLTGLLSRSRFLVRVPVFLSPEVQLQQGDAAGMKVVGCLLYLFCLSTVGKIVSEMFRPTKQAEGE